MVEVPRPPPTRERQRGYDCAHSVGMMQKAEHDAKVAEEEERRRKAAPPSVRTEKWKKPEDSDCPYDRIEVEVRRNAKGQFSRAETSEQLAKRFGITTGSKIPPPKKRRKLP